jgi:hypothetical protein
MGVGLSAPAQAADAITIGASGDVSTLQKQSGSSITVHRYGKLGGPAINNVAFVNIEPTVSWASVANGNHDGDIKRWATALKGTGTRLVSFSHEPMSKSNHSKGTASTFIAAWKRVVNVFNAQGATNVQWVWNVTSHSFRISSSDPDYGAKWYPGDSYVDFVAGEAYNRYKCGTANFSFANRIKEIFAFAKSHGKKMVVAEFGSNAFSGRPAWIKDAMTYMNNNRAYFRGAFYYNTIYGSCHFKLSTSADYTAFRNLNNTL